MSNPSRPDRRVLSLVAATACWGVSAAIAKRAVDEIDPLVLLPLQLAISATALAVGMAATGRRPAWSREHRSLTALGVLNPGLAYALSLAGLQRISASTSVLLWALEPVLILVIGILLWRRVPPPLIVACAAVALGGALLVVASPGQRADTVGVLLTVAGVASCAAYTVWSAALIDQASSVSVVFLQQLAALGFALVILAGATVVGAVDWPTGVSGRAWGSAVVAAIGYYAAAFWLYLDGLRHTSASVAGLFLNLTPVFGVVAAQVLLDERLSSRQWIGSSVVVAAMVVVAAVATTRSGEEAASG